MERSKFFKITTIIDDHIEKVPADDLADKIKSKRDLYIVLTEHCKLRKL